MSTENLDIIPAGYTRSTRKSPFSDMTGPYYEILENGKHKALGLRIRHDHLNRLGMAHGGTIMTIADNALGDSIVAHYDEPISVVTVSLTNEFMRPVYEGDWVEARVEVHRAGKNMIFASCTLTVDQEKVFASLATFSIVKRGTS